jgi:hypothetical protein
MSDLRGTATPDLAAHQRGLLALIVGPAGDAETAPPADPYLARVAASRALPVARGIAAQWRAYTLRRLCPLTWAVLDQRGRLAGVLDVLGTRPLSPFLRLLAAAFADEAVADAGPRDDPLVTAVARFERAVVLPGAAGDRVVIDWPCDPEDALRALLTGQPVSAVPAAPHRTDAPAVDPTAFTIEMLAPPPVQIPGRIAKRA